MEEDSKSGPERPRLVPTGCKGRQKKVYQVARLETEQSEEELHADAGDFEVYDAIFAGVVEIDLQDALKHDACEEWKNAIETEIVSLLRNCTWDIAKKNHVKNVGGCRLVLANKYDSDGSIFK